MTERPCLYYHQSIRFVPGKGWSHPNGSFVVTKIVGVYDCTDCGHQFRASELMNCPECGECNLELRRTEERDDHVATPDYGAAVR